MIFTQMQNVLKKIMYKDRVTIYRLREMTADDGSDDYSTEEERIAENVPCKLSQSNALRADKTAQAVNVSIDLRLYCAPDIDIRETDRLVVTHQGQTFELYAATPFHYPTHTEYSVRRTREAKNDGSSL